MNRFERHPLLTIFIIVVVSVILLDFSAANIYKLIKGYSWPDREQARQQMLFRQVQAIERSYRIKSPVYHHDMAKNVSVSNSVWGYLTYPICTNSLGFKDRAVRDVPLKSDKHRIVFIGDSFTEGAGFSYDDTFAGLIDRELSKQGVEVFNAAVGSYSPIIYWKKIDYLINKAGFKFDELVVFLDISDIQDEALSYALDESGNVVQVRDLFVENKMADMRKDEEASPAGSIVKNAKSFVKNNSILIYYLTKKLTGINYRNNVSLNSRISFWTVDKNLYDEYGEKGLRQCALHMDKLHALLKSRGIKLTVAVYPWPGQVLYDRTDSIQVSYWKKWCAQRDVSFINYFPYFLTGRTESEKENIIDKYYLAGDVHFNKEGHQFMANVFLDDYKKRKNNR